MRSILGWTVGLSLVLTGCQSHDVSDKVTEEHLLDTIQRAFEGPGSSTSTKRQCLDALERAQTLGFAHAEALALYCVATAERDLTQYDSAWRRIEQGLHFFETIGDTEGIYEGWRLQASILQLWGLQDRAADHFLKMLQVGDSTGSDYLDAATLNNYSAIEFNRGNFQRCQELNDRAAELCDPGNLRLRTTIELNKGEVLFQLGHYDRALAQLESFSSDLQRFGAPRFLATHSTIKGKVLAALHRHDEALEVLDNSRTRALEGGFDLEAADSMIAMAEVYFGIDRDEQGVAQLEEALEISERIGALDRVATAHRKLSEALALDEPSRALAHFRRSAELNERVAGEQSQRRLDGLQVILEVESMKADLQNLAQRKRSQRNWLIASAIGLMILAMVSIQLVQRNRIEVRLAQRIRSDHRKLQELHGDLVQANWRELEQVRRATTLGEMAAAFAHELRQPLTAISANALATQRCLPDLSPSPRLITEAVDDIVESAQRAQQIVNRLRRLMRQGELRRRRIDLNEVITEIETLLQREAKTAGGHLVIARTAAPLVVLVDRIQLQQVVLNLVQNGLDANATGPSGEDPPELHLRTLLALEDRQAVLEVEDSGPPVENETLKRMFEPLFSTKADGMGMGLALCEVIAKAHGGTISVSRNPEQGLTFRLALDLASPSD